MHHKKLVKAQSSIILIFIMAALLGCGGGGGGSDSPTPTPAPPAPGAEVLPSSYDFGTVTVGSTAAPLVVKINSVGTADLNVSDIVLSDATNFSIDLNGGPDPCGSISPTLGAGQSCTFEVVFNPTTTPATPFTANIQIFNNHQTRTVDLNGTSEAVNALTVRINQAISNCADAWSAYVSVTDQAGYAYAGLTQGNFDVTLNGSVPIDGFLGPPATPSPLSVVAVLDYSGSITGNPEFVSDMEEGLIDFINLLGASDEAEIIKFANEVEVLPQGGFTSDKSALEVAARSPFDGGNQTGLYKAVNQAIADLSGAAHTRKAVVVLTDGNDDASAPTTLAQVIAQANAAGIPVFPVALNTVSDWNTENLRILANSTGGQLYEALTSDNIRNIYWQLGSVLLQNQYVLSFDGVPSAGNLAISVNHLGTAFHIRQINLCP